ncbi:MAG: type III-B CRISPR module-associated protein Cmr5 [Desulforhopalus sp.]|nr:type III-B CRISPR module-associated protein Cmr5 [Desulforhopalus sp.]
MKSKSQRYAEVVLPNVQKAAEGEWADKYKTLSKKAGSLVRNSGLIQTLAFFKSKTKEQQHAILLGHLQDELQKLSILKGQDDDLLYKQAQEASLPQYMVLTRETLHLLNWHKRFADTLIAKEKGGQP